MEENFSELLTRDDDEAIMKERDMKKKSVFAIYCTLQEENEMGYL